MRTVGILLFPDVEVLDFAGPFEVFSVTKDEADEPAFHVHTVAKSRELVRAVNGLTVLPDYTLVDHPPLDVVVVPGGDGRRLAMRDEAILDWLREVDQAAEVVLSVCTGAFILGHAGLLTGREATTHWSRFDEFADAFPDTPLHRDVAWVDNGHVVTAAGISAGIQASLHLVQRLMGPDVAAHTMQYMVWTGGTGQGHPAF